MLGPSRPSNGFSCDIGSTTAGSPFLPSSSVRFLTFLHRSLFRSVTSMGHYHGQEGFNTFSKLRPIFYQARFSAMKFMAPPYRGFANRLLAFLTK